MARRPRVLILADWFAPGYKAGGPIRSCVNLVRLMAAHVDIRVITHDRDAGDSEGYKDIAPDAWQDFEGKAQVYYMSPAKSSLSLFQALVEEFQPDTTYLNSLFSPHFTGWPLWLKWRGRLPGKLVLAPRGMLHAGALQYKTWKKWPFIKAVRWSGLARKITWQATDEQEIRDIHTHMGKDVEIMLADNIPETSQSDWVPRPKELGEVKAVFVSRIAHKKNIHLILEGLQHVDYPFQWDLFGLRAIRLTKTAFTSPNSFGRGTQSL
ncbi:MAG: hypothetical protein AAFV07_15655, partial [Bacteroidota bacterium]